MRRVWSAPTLRSPGSFLVAFVSTFLPVRCATHLHPAEALRYEKEVAVYNLHPLLWLHTVYHAQWDRKSTPSLWEIYFCFIDS